MPPRWCIFYRTANAPLRTTLLPFERCLSGVVTVTDLCFLTARELVRMVRERQVSAAEIMEAHLTRIEQVNPRLNAIVTLVAADARRAAAQADSLVRSGVTLGPLHGLPVAHKDLVPTKGIRTTFGSRVFADYVPNEDALVVQRLQAAGAITVGKTNTPEFGAGSQTFNEVFGATLNPYDIGMTCGGSSGGAAVALSTGMVPLADGTDMGGSLRNPASFCNVVGLRPSPGRVAVWPRLSGPFPSPSVSGPMARTVADVGLMLSVLAGPDDRDPGSIDQSGASFAQPLGQEDVSGRRVAWSPDLGGLPIDHRVSTVIEDQRQVFESLGCVVEDATPDLRDADEIFRTWRAWYYELTLGLLLDRHRDQIKDTVVWNIEAGRQLSGPDLGRIARQMGALEERVRVFMAHHDYLVLPVSQVPPFSVTQPYVTEINGEALDTYIDWMRSCYYISVTGLPAISVPCGFTPDGLPVGIQIVGRHRDEPNLLQMAYAFEQATNVGDRHPPIPA